MKHIAIIQNIGWGTYNFRKDLISYFIQKGYKVSVFTKFDEYIPQLQALGCECFPLENMNLKGLNPFQDLKLTFEYYTLFKKHHIDFALLYTPKVTIYASIAAQFSKTKSIATINGLGTVFNPNQSSFIQKIVVSLYRFAFRKSPITFFQNTDDRSFFLEKKIINSIEKTLVVKGSGIDLQRFYPKQYDENKNTIVFAFAARMLVEKGIYEYIDAARRVKAKFQDQVQFAIIGSTSFFPGNIDQEKILNAEKDQVVSFWGGTDNMSETLDRVDVLVLPSYYREGVPRILIEGLSKGLPIITTNNVGCKETVEENKNGYLVNIKDVNSLEKAFIKMTMLSPRERIQMGHYSRHKATTECANEIIFQKYDEYIEKLS
ncbi:MAG: glycosyltransferase family 4 protein [Chitinophagaceae bacterium]|nr:MAG: group 1 glycosyl transferase [Bacteroidetes bacterium OLB11]MCC6448493.1 glycosyltransferase family 4 protein [Chitinophagaceae bacterium]HMN33294.1 glycosyltransferase family 4 protein [Chitinophagaceae bacterium]